MPSTLKKNVNNARRKKGVVCLPSLITQDIIVMQRNYRQFVREIQIQVHHMTPKFYIKKLFF